jgi:hypothetical protein
VRASVFSKSAVIKNNQPQLSVTQGYQFASGVVVEALCIFQISIVMSSHGYVLRIRYVYYC